LQLSTLAIALFECEFKRCFGPKEIVLGGFLSEVHRLDGLCALL